MRLHVIPHLRGLICLLLAVYCCTGCFTAQVFKDAKKDRHPERVRAVKQAFIDSARFLVINFTASLDGRRKEEPCHVRVPVDSLVSIFSHISDTWHFAGAEDREKYGLSRIFIMTDRPAVPRPGPGIVMEFTRSVLKQGYYYSLSAEDTLHGKIMVSKKKRDFSYGTVDYEKDPGLNARHIVLVYYPDQPLRGKGKFRRDWEFVAISIEPTSKKQPFRYAYLPASLVVDGVTFPFQLMAWGFWSSVFRN